MKTAHKGSKATKSPKLTQPAHPHQEAPSPTAELLILSPERIEKGVSTTTAVLQEMLERTAQTPGLRHWGINE